MESNKTTIGERIKQQRQKLGLTQQELSQKLYVKRETINQWENGTRQIKGDDIARLADTLETTCDYILRGVETEQLQFYKDLGLTGESVENLRKIASSIGGSESLNNLIGNVFFPILIEGWGYYCAISDDCGKSKTKLLRTVTDSGVPFATEQLSDERCAIIASGILNGTADGLSEAFSTQDSKSVAAQFIEKQDKKEYCKFKLQQVIGDITEDYDNTRR